MASSTGGGHGLSLLAWQGFELLAAPADHGGGGRHHAREQAALAMGREGHVECVLFSHRGEYVELEL
jgi:hypothetical protein